MDDLIFLDFLVTFCISKKSKIILLSSKSLDLLGIVLDLYLNLFMNRFKFLLLDSHDSKVFLKILKFFLNLFVFQFCKIDLFVQLIKNLMVFDLVFLNLFEFLDFLLKLIDLGLEIAVFILPWSNFRVLEIDSIF